MAKENEKKVSGGMNEEELENVAGGWCMTAGKSMPPEVKSIKKVMDNDDSGDFKIITEFKDGSSLETRFDHLGRNKFLYYDYRD